MSPPLTKEAIQKNLPNRLQFFAWGLLELGFSLKYEPQTIDPNAGGSTGITRARIKAKKNEVNLKIVATWLKESEEPQIRLYVIKSVRGHPPGLSQLGTKAFWKAAKNA